MESNIELYEKEGYAWVSVNPKIYSLHVIYSAAYTFLDKCYVLVDGDPDEEIIVELRPKEKTMDLDKTARDFNNVLINYANYATQSSRNAAIREMILKKALLVGDTEKQTTTLEETHGKDRSECREE